MLKPAIRNVQIWIILGPLPSQAAGDNPWGTGEFEEGCWSTRSFLHLKPAETNDLPGLTYTWWPPASVGADEKSQTSRGRCGLVLLRALIPAGKTRHLSNSVLVQSFGPAFRGYVKNENFWIFNFWCIYAWIPPALIPRDTHTVIDILHQYQYKPTKFAEWSPQGEEHDLQVQNMQNIHAQRSWFRQTNISTHPPGHCQSALCCALGSRRHCLIRCLQLWGFSNNTRWHRCNKLHISWCLLLQIERACCNSPLLTPVDSITYQNLNTGTLPSPSLAHKAYQKHGITPDLALSSQHDVNFTCFIKQQHVESNSNAGHIKHVTHRAIKDCLKLSFKVQSSSRRKNETSVAQRIKLCIA